MLSITFVPCGNTASDGRETRMRRKPGETIAELINRAVAKCYGYRCHWFATRGIVYVDVFQGANRLTYRVRVDLHKLI